MPHLEAITSNPSSCWLSIVVSLLLMISTESLAAPIILEASADTNVRADLNARQNDNYGCDPEITVGSGRQPWGTPDKMRGLIQFDLVGITPTTTIVKAILEVSIYSAPLEDVTIYVNQIVDSGDRTPWIEGNGSVWSSPIPGCTGVDPAYGVAWLGIDANNQTQPDFDSTVEASATVSRSVNPGDVVQWDITPLVQKWIDDDVPNYGIVLRNALLSGRFVGVQFRSRERDAIYDHIPGDPPKLIITLVDSDGDGFDASVDCDDNDPAINPDAIELPGNFVDENCDGDLGYCDPCLEWKNHGQYVRCVAQTAEDLVFGDLITEETGDALVTSAAQSKIGKAGFVPAECQ